MSKVSSIFCYGLTAQEIAQEQGVNLTENFKYLPMVQLDGDVKLFMFPEITWPHRSPFILVGKEQNLQLYKDSWGVELLDEEYQTSFPEHLRRQAIKRFEIEEDILVKDVKKTFSHLKNFTCYPESDISGTAVNTDGLAVTYSLEYPNLYFILEGCNGSVGKPKPRVGTKVPLTGKHEAIARRIQKLIKEQNPKPKDSERIENIKKWSERYLR